MTNQTNLKSPQNTQPEEVFQVSEFNEFVNQLLSFREYIVEGEISEINISRNKWVFITLKDPQTEEVLNVFAVAYQIQTYLSLLQVGTLVRVQGYPKLRGKSGRFSLNAYRIIPVGNGTLQEAFLKLKAKLEAEGLFDASRKRTLPDFPQSIFLLTAPNSRAYSDFIKITRERSFGKVKIYHIPISVQGDQAVPSILKALNLVRKYHHLAEVVVITRGGGSLEDLQAFNQEEVVRAAYGLPIPLVSAIGHEADISLIDYIADKRASTPTNAAEVVFPTLNETQQQLELLSRSLAYQLKTKIRAKEHHLSLLQNNLINSISRPLLGLERVATKLKNLMDHRLQKITFLESQLQQITNQLNRLERENYQRTLSSYRQSVKLLNSLNPKTILSRGYSITLDQQGRIIKNSHQLQISQVIKTHLKTGSFTSQIKEIN